MAIKVEQLGAIMKIVEKLSLLMDALPDFDIKILKMPDAKTKEMREYIAILIPKQAEKP